MTESIQENETLLEIKDLTTYFYTEEGTVRAVDGVSFTINFDEIMGLVGETGCGKSVTALSILQLIRYPGKIVKGSINFNGIELLELSKNEILRYRGNEITMIFQDPTNSLNPVFTAGYQIGEVFMLHQKEQLKEEVVQRNLEIIEKLERIKNIKEELKEVTSEEQKAELTKELEKLKSSRLKKYRIKHVVEEKSTYMLEIAGIADAKAILKRYPHELSGGMKQRVMIAMGLACKSKLLICDEPTTALDVTIQAQILELIRELKRKLHTSVLFITHDLGVIHELCDKVAVMYAGKIAEYGTVADIFDNPQHPYTVGLLHSIPRVNREAREKRLAVIPGMVPNLIFDLPGCRFHPRCSHSMKICQTRRPDLTENAKGVKIACFLYDQEAKNQTPELFEKLTDDEKLRYDL
jgi:oligopeptide/dipeptide ABC transporter ATP-binding protein